MTTDETKTYMGYIVLNNRGVPLYPSLATTKQDALINFTGIRNNKPARDQKWGEFKAQGFSVQRCELTVPKAK